MTSLAEFTLPAADFPLGRVFVDKPGVRLELDRVVPSGDTVMPFFWVHDPDEELEGVRSIFDELSALRSITLIEDLGEKGLFRAEWHPEYMGIMGAIAESGLAVISATGSSEGWRFELRATTADQLAAFQQHCDEHAIDVTLDRLSQLSEMAEGTEYNLTHQQREALVLAYELGYYDDDSDIDQETIARELDITRQALSSRLRRGYRNLIGTTIAGADSTSDS